MSNLQRGEITASLGGKERTFCLTLGALAELEGNLSDEDIIAFTDRLTQGHIKAHDLVCLLGAALRGGGEQISDEEVASMMPEGGFGEAVQLAARLIAVAFGGAEGAEQNKKKDERVASLGKT